jgi:hypothetical protein
MKRQRASKDSLTSPKLIGGTLTISGYVCDTVQQVGDVYELVPGNTWEVTTETAKSATLSTLWSLGAPILRAIIKATLVSAQWDRIAMEKGQRDTNGDVHDVYWQTLTCMHKSDLVAFMEGHEVIIDQQQFWQMYDAWYASRRFTRLCCRLGFSRSFGWFPLCLHSS